MKKKTGNRKQETELKHARRDSFWLLSLEFCLLEKL